MKVFVVENHGPEHNHIKSIYKTYEIVLKAWDKLRESLLEDAKSSLKNDKHDPE